MSLPRMSLHIGDYLKKTSHLRAAGHGAYLLLIMHYWSCGGLPDDDDQLAAIACMSKAEWKKHKPIIKPLFKDGDWKHRRIEEELADANAKYEKRAAAGKLGGNAKAKAMAKDKQCSSNATAKSYQPITDNLEEERKKDAAPNGAQATDQEVELFRRGKEILGQSSGGLIAKLLKAKGKIPLARAIIETAATKENAREYVSACLRGHEPERGIPGII